MLTPGQDFAHFKIVQKLGEGGMGEVYLAEDQKLNRRVALKTLRDDYFDNQDRRERFQREAKTAAQISHANVMAIYDIGVTRDAHSQKDISYIVMEYVKGTSLEDFIAGKKNDTAALLRLAEKIASGIAAAHRLNIVHRDIKAENILVDEHDEPKILDFGLAKPIDPIQMGDQPISGETVKKDLTRVGTVIGTVSYMSPEQARGEVVDTRADIFSFGVLLFRMFTGELPFTGSTQVSILAKILEAHHPAPKSKNVNIDSEIERIIDKCLQKNAADRYQDSRDLVVDLRNLRRQYDSGVSSTTSSVTSQIDSAIRIDRKKQRIKRLIRVAVILLVVMTAMQWRGISVIKKLVTGESNSSAQAGVYTLAILGFDNKTGDSEFDLWKTGLPELLLTDLSQDQSINIISQRRVLEALGGKGDDLGKYTYEDQVKAARRLGAVNVLSGSIFKLGDKIRIDARLEDIATGKVLFGEKVVSSDPMTLVDSLANRLGMALNMRGMASSDRGVAQLTTASPEAYRYYHLGILKFLDEFYEDAIANFHKALAIDSTFALAYMRIGMSYVFQGRLQDGVPYIAKAKEFDSHLPVKDRSLLDVYAEIWLKQNFDLALTKMKTLVDTYPDDMESRSVYALLRWQLNKDTTGALRLFQEVFDKDPKYPLALIFVVQYYEDLKNYDKAIEYSEKWQHYYPESPVASRKLGELHILQGKLDEATAAYNEVLQKYPGDADALLSLVDCLVRKRDFAEADRYLEVFRASQEGNSYRMSDYYRWRAGLANWSGKFKSSMKYRFDVLGEAHKTKDSVQIIGALQAISQYYQAYGLLDSAVSYYQKSLPWVTTMQRLNYPVGLVSIDRSYADKVRPMLQQMIPDFRQRFPANLQPLCDHIQTLFDGYASADTAMIIDALEKLIKTGATTTDTRRDIGEFCVLTRQFKKGIDLLQPFVSGGTQTGSGYFYPYVNYLLGIAYEGTGDTKEATRCYREMLKYWGAPEIEIAPIKDAKARLTKLTS